MAGKITGRRCLIGIGPVATASFLVTVVMLHPTAAYAAEEPVDLGTAADYSVLAHSTVTNTGPSDLGQNLGVHPGTTNPGFPPGDVQGEIHLGDAEALQASNDLIAAYDDAAGRTPFTSLAAQLGGRTLTPGVYRLGAAQLTGELTLNAQNNNAAVFIFQISSTLITASNSDVTFINGASPCNVYWQVGSSATLGTGTDFVGTIMAQAAITMNTGADLEGRALARTAAVTLDDNVITAPICAAATVAPTTSAAPTSTATATATASPTTAAPTRTSTAGVPVPTGTPDGPPETTPGGPELPRTGQGATAPLLATAGGLLIAAGVSLLMWYRRRPVTLHDKIQEKGHR